MILNFSVATDVAGSLVGSELCFTGHVAEPPCLFSPPRRAGLRKALLVLCKQIFLGSSQNKMKQNKNRSCPLVFRAFFML